MNPRLYTLARCALLHAILLFGQVAFATNNPVVLGRWPGGHHGVIGVVRLSGDYAYCAAGTRGLIILSVQDRTNITYAGACEVPGKTLDVAVDGSTAFAAAHKSGLQVIDISIPQSPTILGSFTNCDVVKAVEVIGNRAYLADGTNGLRICNVSDPAQPQLIGGFTQTNVFAEGLAISGSRAYLAAGTRGLLVVDISNELAPVLLGSYETPGFANNIKLDGTTAYVADGNAGICSLDVSNPANILKFASLPVPGYIRGIALAGSHLFLSAGDAGTHLVCITNLASPVLTASHTQHSDWVGGVAVSGGLAYVAAGPRLDVLDLSGPLPLVGSYVVGRRAVSVAEIEPRRALVSDALAGWQMLDLLEDNTFALRAAHSGPTFGGRMIRGYLFSANENSGVGIWNTDPSGFTLLSRGATNAYANAVVPAYGPFVCVAGSGAGLQILDTTDPANPVTVGSFNTPGVAYSVAVQGTIAYVADGVGGVAVIDIGNPVAPTRLAWISSPNRVEDVALYDHYLLAAVRNVGVRVYDISNPTSTGLVSTWNGIPTLASLSCKATGASSRVAQMACGF